MQLWKNVIVVHLFTFWVLSEKISQPASGNNWIVRTKYLIMLSRRSEITLELLPKSVSNPAMISCMILGIENESYTIVMVVICLSYMPCYYLIWYQYSNTFRITFARYPNHAMFGKRSKGTEVCKLSRKLLKICHGWINEEAIGACSFCHGDEFKIRKNVLDRAYPDLCEALTQVLGTYTPYVHQIRIVWYLCW